MPTIGERNAARAQRNMDRNAVIQQDNTRSTALLIEDRIRELETRNMMLESRVEAMGNVIARQALAQQQEVQLQIPVSQDDVVYNNQVRGPGDVSKHVPNALTLNTTVQQSLELLYIVVSTISKQFSKKVTMTLSSSHALVLHQVKSSNQMAFYQCFLL
ncbi:hypothetical protein BDC45DRAFT_351946 [Circinella umbellata]|nr:hypothetical protein BDC45DRAFT_351946 [Circinella umbellata]